MNDDRAPPLPAYPRDLVGYGRNPPHAAWPDRARIALQFVLNHEEGGENAVPHGDAGSEQFLSEMFNTPSFYLGDSFDALYAEGDPNGLNQPKMMRVGMHCRLLGRPGRIVALQRFLDHVEKHQYAWVCRRVDIAQHWQKTHPYTANHAG